MLASQSSLRYYTITAPALAYSSRVYSMALLHAHLLTPRLHHNAVNHVTDGHAGLYNFSG